MLKKMLKHDMRAMWRTAMPLLLVSGIVSAVCCGMLYFTLNFSESSDESLIGILTLVGSFYVMGLIAVIVLPTIISVFVLVRYYKSLFTDEGYLTMVLPMSSTTLINEKILFTLIWWVITCGAIVVGVGVSAVLPITLYSKEILTGIIESFKFIFGSLLKPSVGLAASILNGILIALRLLESAMLTTAAITVGATVVRKRRLLGAFLFYFGVTFLRENVVTVFEAIIDIVLVAGTNTDLGVILALVFGLVISSAITVAAYLVMKNIFTKKFNIE